MTTEGAVPQISVVLGPHRTGTSAVTQMLWLLGTDLGPEEQLLGAIETDNKKGFFEHEQLMLVNDELLKRLGGSWRDPPMLADGWERDASLEDLLRRAQEVIERDFAGARSWGFKDPRISLTLPFWRRLIDPTLHVICTRNPLEVARSLEHRNNIPLAHGVALWAHYTAHAILNTAGRRRVFVSYDELFDSRDRLLNDLATAVGHPERARDRKLKAQLNDWIEAQLRHHRSSTSELLDEPAVSSRELELWLLLELQTSSRSVAHPPGVGGGDLLARRIAAGEPPRQRRAESPKRAGASVGPRRRPLRIVALLQVYNERRFIAGCIEHLREQGVHVYVIDNESTDETLDIVQRYEGRGVIGIETLPRQDCFALRVQCARQEELAQTLDADWFIHYDADEIRSASKPRQTLAEAIEEFNAAGFNAVNFLEFAFVPTREFPDHDHPHFQQTMRWYYPFLPRFPHRCNAWKRQDFRVDLKTDAGHTVRFPGLRMAPRSLYMRHYLYISLDHALDKFVRRQFAADEVADGWFGWRSQLREEMITLPSVTELRHFVADHLLDPSDPLKHHLLEPQVPPAIAPAAG